MVKQLKVSVLVEIQTRAKIVKDIEKYLQKYHLQKSSSQKNEKRISIPLNMCFTEIRELQHRTKGSKIYNNDEASF